MTTPTLNAEELEKFTTYNRREILFYLRQLINEGERVSVVFNEGSDTVLTVLLDIDEANDRLIFDWGGSEEANHKLLRSAHNHFVCSPHGVKNQFVSGAVREISYQQRVAFVTGLPDHFTRLQRREYFRLTLPLTRRPPCFIAQNNGPSLQLSVVDLSIGGISAELPGSRLPFSVGQVLPQARIELKGFGTLEVDLEVRNASDVQRGGKVNGRIGCRFVKVSNAMENQLQRFITDVQREERARLGSL